MYNVNFAAALLLMAVTSLVSSGCAPSYAPSRYLPSGNGSQWDVYGGWIRLELDSQSKDSSIDGEFISFQDSSVFVLTKNKLVCVPYTQINHAEIEFHSNLSAGIGIWTTLGFLSTVSHGFFLIFTAPTWLLVGIPSSVSESYSGKLIEDTPNLAWWAGNRKFSRFPQGIPKTIDPKRLQQKNSRP